MQSRIGSFFSQLAHCTHRLGLSISQLAHCCQQVRVNSSTVAHCHQQGRVNSSTVTHCRQQVMVNSFTTSSLPTHRMRFILSLLAHCHPQAEEVLLFVGRSIINGINCFVPFRQLSLKLTQFTQVPLLLHGYLSVAMYTNYCTKRTWLLMTAVQSQDGIPLTPYS